MFIRLKILRSFSDYFRGTKTLQEILCDRENISHSMQVHLDEGTDPWGVKVERVEMLVHQTKLFFVLIFDS